MPEFAGLIDTHVHLDQYPQDMVEGLIKRAAGAGVDRLLAIGISIPTSRAAIDIARRFPGVRAVAGIHPRRLHEAGDLGLAFTDLARLVAEEGVVGIGEAGLDYAPDAAPPAVQRTFLAACLELARRTDRAVVLHVVGAHEDALRVLDQAGGGSAVLHHFLGDASLAGRYLSAGCHISVGKPVTRRENAALRSAVAAIPIDRLLIETDSYPLPGRATEPRDLTLVRDAVADVRGTDPAAIAAATTANAERLFRLH